MSGWISITSTIVRAYAHEARITKAWDASTTAEETGWFTEIRDGVVSLIRARIAQRIPLDADETTVPPELKELAGLRILSAVLARLGQLGTTEAGNVFTLTTEQRDRLRDGGKLLDDIAAGKARVTAPTGATTADLGAAPRVQVAAGNSRRFTRDTTDGL